MIHELILAILQLGAPIAILSGLLLRRLYDRGALSREDDFDDLGGKIKPRGVTDFVESKWVMLGGGFYGAAALWTLIVMEIDQGFGLLSDLPWLIEELQRGIINLAITFFIEQLMTFIDAALWFLYWPSQSSFIAVWFVVAYFSYQIGARYAKDSA